MRKMVMTVAAVAALAIVSATAGLAQGVPGRVRGTIESLDGNQLAVRSREGTTVWVTLGPDLGVMAVVRASLADVKEGSFVGIAALPQPGGAPFRAQEVLIFPESARGIGEGHYPWDLTPESTMTNATVAAVVTGVEGPVLRLTPKGIEIRILVPPDVPVVTVAPGDPSLLVPGAPIFFSGTPAGDGSLVASRILVGRDGVVPPM